MCGREDGGESAAGGKGKTDTEPEEWCVLWRLCSELKLRTLTGGENGLLTPECGVGGMEASGVRNGSRGRMFVSS